MNPIFIAVTTPKKNGRSQKYVKEKFDVTIKSKSDKRIHDELTKYITDKERVVIISENVKLCEITEKIYNGGNKTVHTIYLSNQPIINPSNTITKTNKNITYVGIDQNLIDDGIKNQLENNLDIKYFTVQKIRQVGMQKIMQNIMVSDNLVHLIVDLRVVDYTLAPSVKRNESQGNFLINKDIDDMINVVKDKVNYLDIIGFDYQTNEPDKHAQVTGQICKKIIKEIFEIKEKSINIFNEKSKFLIYRPTTTLSEADVGWYIVRFITLKEREEIIKNLNGNVITLTIDVPVDNKNETELEVFITETSLEEQNKKSYYTAASIFDYCLFPQEKLDMTFEILNTPDLVIY